MSPDPYTIGAGMVVVLIAATFYDIYLEQDDVDKNTYSEVLRKWYAKKSWLYYLTGFVFGVLLSHWGLK